MPLKPVMDVVIEYLEENGLFQDVKSGRQYLTDTLTQSLQKSGEIHPQTVQRLLWKWRNDDGKYRIDFDLADRLICAIDKLEVFHTGPLAELYRSVDLRTDEEKAEQVRTLRDAGMSREDAAKEAGVTNSFLVKHGIRWKVTA